MSHILFIGVKPNVFFADGRRKKLLEHQKHRRTDALNVARALIHGELDEDSDDDCENTEESMDTSAATEYYHRKLRVRKSYKKQLMLSEWLLHVPDDFYTSWQMVPVPEGKVDILRFLVEFLYTDNLIVTIVHRGNSLLNISFILYTEGIGCCRSRNNKTFQ